MTASCCCQSKQHAVRALFAAVALHILCIFLAVASCAAPFLYVTYPPIYPSGCGRYGCTYNSYVPENKVAVGAADLPLSFAVPAIAFLALGMVLSVLASVFICLRACRLRRSLQGSSSESKGCHTRAYTTLVLSILSTLSYITGACVIYGAAIPLARYAQERFGAAAVAGPGYSCASLALTLAIATSILEGVSHCCCKVKASPATSTQSAAATMPAFLDKLAAPPGYVLAFVPASSAMQALPLPLPTHTPPFPTTATAASIPAAALAASNPPPAAEKLV